MKREDLLKSKSYWMAQLQNNLFAVIESHMKKKKINRQELANELGVSKGYISQILNGDFDHKISKFVELSLACNQVPIITFVDLNTYISHDLNQKVYDLIPMMRPKQMSFSPSITYLQKNKPNIKLSEKPIASYSLKESISHLTHRKLTTF